MKTLHVDSNGRAVQCTELSVGDNFSVPGVIKEIEPNQMVRIKAIAAEAVIKPENTPGAGVVISENETEYFYLTKRIELVSGEINVMY